MERLTNKEKGYINRILYEYDQALAKCKSSEDINEVGLLFKRLFQDVDGFVCFGRSKEHCAMIFNRIHSLTSDKKAIATACNKLEEAYIEIIQGIHFVMSLYSAGLVVFKWLLAPNEELIDEDEGDASKYVHLPIHDSDMEAFIQDHHYASILPTPALKEFVKRGYIDAATKRHNQIMCATWTSISIAVLTSVLSLLLH